MKKYLTLLLIIILFSSCTNLQKQKLTSDEIWDKYINNFGPKEKLLVVKTYSYTFETDSEEGKTYSSTKVKFPDKVYQEHTYPNNQTVIFILNGDSAIMKSPKGIEHLSKSHVIRSKQMALIFPEIYYKELGYAIKLIGEEVHNNKIYYNLQVITDLDTLNYIIGQDDFEIYKLIDSQSTLEILSTIDTDSIQMVEKTKSTYGNEVSVSTLIKHELNIEINDSIFKLK